MTTYIDAEQLLGALSFSLEINATPVLVDIDGLIFIAPFGSHYTTLI